MIKTNKKVNEITRLLGVLFFVILLVGGCTQTAIYNTNPETQNQIIENINSVEGYNLIYENKGNSDFLILDVRTPEEFLDEHIENAININYYSGSFKKDLGNLDKEKIYLVYCRSGNRSEITLQMMKDFDFREAYNLLGGINKWKSEGFSTIK